MKPAKARPRRSGDEQRQGAALYRSAPLWRLAVDRKSWKTSSVLAHLGPEPLSDAFNAEYLKEKSREKAKHVD